MTAGEAIAYIENCGWSATRLGLGRTRELLERLGNPQEHLRFIHVAGSNGKGSTCAMLGSILRSAGYRTGLYTSPHLVRFNERICVDGREITDEELAGITEVVAAAADAMDDHPSQFELSTAIAFEYFLKKRCDIVVLEVGMGGELDSTNVIGAPLAAVITNIGLDHTEYLGDTISKIARTKCGIIKAGSCAVCYDLVPEAYDVVAEICMERSVPLRKADFQQLKSIESSVCGQRIVYKGNEYMLSLAGTYQMYNAATVLEVIDAIRERGFEIPQGAVEDGLSSAGWSARFEVLNNAPTVILDGGHNPQCAGALAENIGNLFPGRRAVFLTGMLKDKDYPEVISILGSLAECFVCVTPDSPRALKGEELAAAMRSRGYTADSYNDYESAVIAALDRACMAADGERAVRSGETGSALPVIIFGSLYMAGSMKVIFRRALRSWIRHTGIRARDAVPADKRKADSENICARIIATEAYRNAGSIMLYKSVRAEVSLEALEERAVSDGKRLCYPVVRSKGVMAAVWADPGDEASWRVGAFGISEPVLRAGAGAGSSADGEDCRNARSNAYGEDGGNAGTSNQDTDPCGSDDDAEPDNTGCRAAAGPDSNIADPEEIDLVVCPLTAFDDRMNRLGMGGGYYDRFLPGCVNAVVLGAAFSVQRFAGIPAEEHDVRLDAVVTEA